MMIGIIEKNPGEFAVKDFASETIVTEIGSLSFPTKADAIEHCKGQYYDNSFYLYLMEVAGLQEQNVLTKKPDADIWENLIYAGDYRGCYDNEAKEYRNVTSMDKGAADEDEIDYVDALAITYQSICHMVQ